jgi:hypothetical protein
VASIFNTPTVRLPTYDLHHIIQKRDTVDLHMSNGLILEQLETRTKNSRKIRFETRIKIRKSNHEHGFAQHRVAHAI